MHLAQQYINSIYSGPPASFLPLTNAQAAVLERALIQDAMSYTYSGIVSLTEAISGVDRGAFSWSTVKSYYSAFYLLRAILAIKKIGIFYWGSKPFYILSLAGQVPTKVKGNTHEAVLSLFKAHANSHWLLSQEIDGGDPLDWIRRLREEANYTRSRFIEPGIPKQFLKFAQIGSRRAVTSYLANDQLAFDPDHAVIAYPLRALIFITSDIKGAGEQFNALDKKFLSSLCKDKDGPIATFNALLSQ